MAKTKTAHKRGIDIASFFLSNVRKHPRDIVKTTADHFGITRQAVLRHVKRLERENQLSVKGTTRNRIYEPLPLVESYKEYVVDNNLAEDKVWRESIFNQVGDSLKPTIRAICQYGLTEMINNVIDHSGSKKMLLAIKIYVDQIEIFVKDFGVGIFNKVQNDLGLDDPMHVILELSKGKLTTNPETHSGQGIFFTSRMFDTFTLYSGNICFTHLVSIGDWLVEDRDIKLEGTSVNLIINPFSKRTIQKVFDEFTADNDYGFSRTKVPVMLAKYGDENLISRSQAKRLLARFDRFQEIYLNFKDVDMIGQAFADEVFRVFRNQHPEIDLFPTHTNENVMRMIERVESTR